MIKYSLSLSLSPRYFIIIFFFRWETKRVYDTVTRYNIHTCHLVPVLGVTCLNCQLCQIIRSDYSWTVSLLPGETGPPCFGSEN